MGYVLCFNVVVFFLMLNFLLAIIVEAYSKVAEEVATNEAARDLFTDIYLTTQARLKTMIWHWPSHHTIIGKIESMGCKKTVSMKNLRSVFPSWQLKSLHSFLEHYGAFDALRPPHCRQLQEIMSLSESVNVIEDRVACLLGTSRLSKFQRAIGAPIKSRRVASKEPPANAIKEEHEELSKMRQDRTAIASRELPANAIKEEHGELSKIRQELQELRTAIASKETPAKAIREDHEELSKMRQELQELRTFVLHLPASLKAALVESEIAAPLRAATRAMDGLSDPPDTEVASEGSHPVPPRDALRLSQEMPLANRRVQLL